MSGGWSAAAAEGTKFMTAGLNWIASAHSAKKQFKYASALQEQAAKLSYNYTRKLNQNAYQDTTYSMREAGINPMLAISQGINGLSANAPTGSVNVTTPQGDLDATSALQLLNDSKRVANESKHIKNESDNTKSNISLNDANEEAARANADSAKESAKATKIQNEFAPVLQQAQLQEIKSRIRANEASSAKSYNDMVNASRSTQANIDYLGVKGSNETRDSATRQKNIPLTNQIADKIKHNSATQNLVKSYRYMRSHSAKQIYDSEMRYLINRYGKKR